MGRGRFGSRNWLAHCTVGCGLSILCGLARTNRWFGLGRINGGKVSNVQDQRCAAGQRGKIIDFVVIGQGERAAAPGKRRLVQGRWQNRLILAWLADAAFISAGLASVDLIMGRERATRRGIRVRIARTPNHRIVRLDWYS